MIKNFFGSRQLETYKNPTLLFWILAVLPFYLSDIILRFVVNFIFISDIKYNLIPVIFNTLWIFGIVYFCRNILPKMIGIFVYSVFYYFFAVLTFVNYIYFCFFDQYIWLRNMVLAGEGLNYAKDALAYVNVFVVLLFILYIADFVFVIRLWKKPKYEKPYVKYIVAAIPFFLLFVVQAGIKTETSKQIENGAWEIWDKPLLVYDKFTDSNKSLNIAGLYQFTFKSIYCDFIAEDVYTKEDKLMADEFFAQKNTTAENDLTGILKDKNVVFVLMESLDDWVVSKEYTPTIKYMMDNGINFKNHYMPNVGSGYTFNAEFAMNTGFYCPSDESSASVFTENHFPNAMANVFKNNGYSVNSFHFNNKDFYNRKTMHSRFGYEDYYCLMNYMPIEKCIQDGEVPLVDEIYNNMTKDKFFSFYISYSCHLPYNTVDNKLKGAMEKYPEYIDDSLDEETRNLLLLAHDTDEFFRLLIERLKEDGIYEDTVIIGVADHYAYGIMDKEKLLEYSKDKGSDILEKVPFFIYSPSLEKRSVTKVTSSIDIVPTILNLFGLESKNYLGSDAFDTNYSGFVYFPDGSWYDGKIKYTTDDDIESYSEKQQEHIKSMNELIIKYNAVNDYVVKSNYFKK